MVGLWQRILPLLVLGCGLPGDGLKYADTAGEGTFGSVDAGCEMMAKWMVECGVDSVQQDTVLEACLQEIEVLSTECTTEAAAQYSSGLEDAYTCFLELNFCGTEEDIETYPDALDTCGALFDAQFTEAEECFSEDGETSTNLGAITIPEDIPYETSPTLRNRLSLEDDAYQTVEVPFELSFFGESFKSITITSNGVLFLGEVPFDGCCYGLEIPRYDEYNGLIALGWGDLVPDMENSIAWQVLGEEPTRELWIQYDNVPAITDVDEVVSSRMRWVEGTAYVDIFIDQIVYSDPMTIGVESVDAQWASVLPEHNATAIQSDKRGLRYAAEVPQ